MFAYHGRFLRIDVTTGRSAWIELSSDLLRRYIGGVGLGAYLLLREDAATCDPLSAENPLIFAFSPLVGSPITTSAKFAVVSKSPLTGRFNDSLVSSGFAIGGKSTGADAVVIVGRAASPSILVIDDGRVSLVDATPYVGLTVRATELALRQALGADFHCAVIGPAGERGARYATISHDGRHAGRGGHGAVLGAKNIKAIAVRGALRCEWAHPNALARLSKDLSARSLGPATAKYRELGTIANLAAFHRLQALPSRNFQSIDFPGVASFAPDVLDAARTARGSCVACTIGCEHMLKPRIADASSEPVRMEYESLFALGPLCGISEINVVLAAARLCDDYGLDTISAGGTIAFAMECSERGLLDAPWLRFGDGDGLLRALELIARREGLGDQLAEGSRRLAITIGRNASSFAPHVKGLELPGYEPRTMQTMALGFAVAARGADHNRSGAYEADFSERVNRFDLSPAHAAEAVASEDRAALIDSLILCKFLRAVFSDLWTEAAELLHLVTGWHSTPDDLRAVARRTVDARKRFNIRAGWQPEEDTLPDRFFETAMDYPAALSREKLAAGVRTYYRLRGWTDDGFLRGSDSLGRESQEGKRTTPAHQSRSDDR